MNTGKENKGWKEDFLAWERSGGTIRRENLLWEKLHGRLEPRRSEKKTWLRAAAILFLIATSCFLLLQRKRLPQGSAFSLKIPAARTIPVKKEILPPPATAPEKDLVSVPAISPSSHSLPVEKMADTLSFTEIDQPPANLVNLETIQRANIASASTQPVAAPARKKIRIVHLNEWNSPPPPSYATMKESWKMQQIDGPSETDLSEKSLWPGKNRNRLPPSPNN